jgi:phenylpyruvate tautomerase PptA (4-oxalocrotonate tautomerase family)
MPINVHATEGILNTEAEKTVFSELTNLFLRLHQLEGNQFITPNVIGEVRRIPAEQSYAGGKRAGIVIIELKVPSFALTEPNQREVFIEEATDIVQRASGGRQPKERIWVNMVYAIDGFWGIGGKSYTNDQLIAAVSQEAASG